MLIVFYPVNARTTLLFAVCYILKACFKVVVYSLYISCYFVFDRIGNIYGNPYRN